MQFAGNRSPGPDKKGFEDQVQSTDSAVERRRKSATEREGAKSKAKKVPVFWAAIARRIKKKSKSWIDHRSGKGKRGGTLESRGTNLGKVEWK